MVASVTLPMKLKKTGFLKHACGTSPIFVWMLILLMSDHTLLLITTLLSLIFSYVEYFQDLYLATMSHDQSKGVS